jgi:hypothetical protein
LAEVLSTFVHDDAPDGHLVIGIEPGDGHVELHVAPLPHDERAGSAGLFGMRAGRRWCAVAVAVSGRARDARSLHVRGDARALVVVDRDGGIASHVVVDHDRSDASWFEADDDPTVGAEIGRPGSPAGLTVDALHRMLGLPSPGEPPATPRVALAMWSQLLILHVLEHGVASWAQAVALHPGHPAHQGAEASIETVAEATLRTEGELDWHRMHRRACRHGGPGDLTANEVAWMDPTLFARWMLGSLPDAELAAQVLVAHGQERTARSLLEVAARVDEALGPLNPV